MPTTVNSSATSASGTVTAVGRPMPPLCSAWEVPRSATCRLKPGAAGGPRRVGGSPAGRTACRPGPGSRARLREVGGALEREVVVPADGAADGRSGVAAEGLGVVLDAPADDDGGPRTTSWSPRRASPSTAPSSSTTLAAASRSPPRRAPSRTTTLPPNAPTLPLTVPSSRSDPPTASRSPVTLPGGRSRRCSGRRRPSPRRRRYRRRGRGRRRESPPRRPSRRHPFGCRTKRSRGPGTDPRRTTRATGRVAVRLRTEEGPGFPRSEKRSRGRGPNRRSTPPSRPRF
jgi:hypothetical protein